MKINRVKCKYCNENITMGSTHACINSNSKELWKSKIHSGNLSKRVVNSYFD